MERYLKRCLISVLNQTYQGSLECILVNDCTPDDSMKVVHDMLLNYTGKIEMKLLYHEKNRGLSAARNTGIRHATGDYLYFLDSDDEISLNCIETLVDSVLQYPRVDIVQGNIIVTDPAMKWLDISKSNFPVYTEDQNWIRNNMLSTIPVTAWNKLIRKQFLLDYDLWFREGIIHEDSHWCLFANEHIRTIAFCTTPTYYYYINEGSIMNSVFKDKSLDSFLIILRDYLQIIKSNELKKYQLVLSNLAAFRTSNSKLKDSKLFLKKYRILLYDIWRNPKSPFVVKLLVLYLLLPSFFIRKKVIYYFFSFISSRDFC